MKISETLNNEKLALSFEVFPPKTDSNFESVKTAVAVSESFDFALAEMTHYRRKIIRKSNSDKKGVKRGEKLNFP